MPSPQVEEHNCNTSFATSNCLPRANLCSHSFRVEWGATSSIGSQLVARDLRIRILVDLKLSSPQTQGLTLTPCMQLLHTTFTLLRYQIIHIFYLPCGIHIYIASLSNNIFYLLCCGIQGHADL